MLNQKPTKKELFHILFFVTNLQSFSLVLEFPHLLYHCHTVHSHQFGVS